MTSKYPARDHAARVADELNKLIPDSEKNKASYSYTALAVHRQLTCYLWAQTHAIFLQGSPVLYRDDTDRELIFHQEANFNYLSGVLHPGCSLIVFLSFHHDSTAAAAVASHNLFIPPEDPAETMWSVPPPSISDAEAVYDSDKIQHTTAIPSFLESKTQGAGDSAPGEIVLHTLPRTMEYPALPSILDSINGVVQSSEFLFEALHIARLVKDQHEIDLIAQANKISSGAHEVVMRELGRFAREREQSKAGKPTRNGKEGLRDWEIESEGDAEAVFVAACRRMGSTTQAYLPIVASGSRASTLHYVCNDRLFPSTALPRQPGDTSFEPAPLARGCCGTLAPAHSHATSPTALHHEPFHPQVLLIDAGCEWQGYASDITRTIPVGNGGRFTKEGGEVYDLVLKMQKECEALVKPGVHWDTLHLHAHRVLVDGLLNLGIFKGEPEAILQSGVTAGLFPHGLGHSLGLDVHDTRQYLKSTHLLIPSESGSTPAKLYAYLRIRQPLIEGMVLTVEPGCYFAPQLMEEHGVWDSPFVDTEVLKRYTSVGGVRIEDVVVVRSSGCENLTTVGREREWLEKVCSGSE